MTRLWKGKARAEPQTEGSGGAEGIVLPLQVTGSGVYDIAYILEISVGAKQQKLPLQIDTGSSDLWITSRSCTSSLCGQTNGRTYDPSGSTDTEKDFLINYLQGSVSGPIVWDKVEIGGYSIEAQAIAAADSVDKEPLSSQFTGILGLALPLNSIIADLIPPTTSNSPDGAAWASNLFSITPVSSAPAARFLSLSLSRPGTTAIPSLLGIGRHPAALVPDPSLINYSTIVSERSGTLYWKSSVQAITVYADGVRKEVNVGRSFTGAVFPSAVLDTGVPLILTTRNLANAIYGAINIGPASDGQYYVPCTTPLNLTITLDDRPEIPLHPLDLTAEPPQDNKAVNCVGLIQAADSAIASPGSPIGDMILGVPFMRNTYTVMAYAVPDDDGTFPILHSTNNSDDGEGSQPIRPRLGLLPLTNPTQALDEFRRVRVLNQPIQSGSSSPGGMTKGETIGPKKLSVGIIVLVCLVGFFALCFLLFGLRWFLIRRRWRRAGTGGANGAGAGSALSLGLGAASGDRKEMGGYVLARRGSGDTEHGRERLFADGLPDEDVLQKLRYEAYMQDHTLVTDIMPGKKVVSDEMGYRTGAPEKVRTGADADAWDPDTALGRRSADAWGDDTLVGKPGAVDAAPAVQAVAGREPVRDEDGYGHHNHARQQSEDDVGDPDNPHALERLRTPPQSHLRGQSIVVPLLLPTLGHARTQSTDDEDPGVDEFGRMSMAGIGTVSRAGKIDPAMRASVISAGSVYSSDSGRSPVRSGGSGHEREERPAGGGSL